MKILYIVSTLKLSGPTNNLKQIIKYIDRGKYKIYIISLSSEPVLSLVNEFIKMNVKCINLGVSRKNVFILVKRLKQAVENIKPDIIQSNGLRIEILSTLFLKNRYNCCCRIDNYVLMYCKLTYLGFWAFIILNIRLWLIKNNKYPIACSYSVRDMLLKKYNIFTHTIQNGVDISYFRPINENYKQNLRRQLNLPLNKKIIVSAGHLSVLKDPITIINAFSKSNLLYNYYLLFLGEGNLRAETENMAKRFSLPCIFKGQVSDVIKYLQASDYFISASKTEGLPNGVLEAGAVGLPLILSDIFPHKEILSDKKIGYIFTTGNVNSLLSILNSLQNVDFKKYKKISELTRKLIVRNFSAEAMSKKYQNFYNEIINVNYRGKESKQ